MPAQTSRNYRISHSRPSRDLHIDSLFDMKHDFMNVSEQLGLIANLR
jgi:hypothetical protein